MIASTLSVWGIRLCEGRTPKLDPQGGRVGRNANENSSPYTNERDGGEREARAPRAGLCCGACVLDTVDVERVWSILRMRMWTCG
jgi:hypothetical protein